MARSKQAGKGGFPNGRNRFPNDKDGNPKEKKGATRGMVMESKIK
jgi:hypothetical protein